MSTKTLRKRIALVAVTTLGAGLLSVVAAPSASAAVTITIAANGATSSSTQGLLTGGGLAAITGTAATTGTATMLASGQLSITTVAGAATSALVLSGGTVLSCAVAAGAGTATLSADLTTCSISGTGTLTVLAKPTAAGTNMVIYGKTTNSATSWATESMHTVSVVASSTMGAYSAADSFFATMGSGAVATSNIDATYTGASTDGTYSRNTVINSNIGYIGHDFKDSNGNALVGSVIGGNVSGANCLIGAGQAGTFNAASGLDASSWFQVSQAVANTPATCTVSVSINGVVVGTRTITIQGQVTKVTALAPVVRVKASTTSTSAAAVYVLAYDAAGNAIDNVTISPVTTYYNSALTSVSSITTSPNSASATANSSTITCVAKGAQKIKFAAVNASTTTIYSDELPFFCAGGIVTYSASLDKASYTSGDIATLTITAKDSAGNLTHDYATVGAGVSIAGSNMTAVSALATTDAFTNGVKKYKFIVGTTEGSYSMAVDLAAYNDPTTPQDSATVAYKITGSGAVSNADVLKAIVSLIASINKQIAALQKALLKK
jgi:hypothetical protein